MADAQIYVKPGYDSLGNKMNRPCVCGCGEAYHRSDGENGPRTGKCYGPIHRHLGPGGSEDHCPTNCMSYQAR